MSTRRAHVSPVAQLTGSAVAPELTSARAPALSEDTAGLRAPACTLLPIGAEVDPTTASAAGAGGDTQGVESGDQGQSPASGAARLV